LEECRKEITLTDLEMAIMQADDYRHYRHANPSFKATDEGLAWSIEKYFIKNCSD
jgi:hypothetical protein